MDFSKIGRPGQEGIIVDWLAKLIVVIGIGGLVAVEGFGVLIARYQAAEGAAAAATQAALGLRTGTGDPEALAALAAEQHGCRLISFTKDSQSQTVSVTVDKQARTFFIQRWGPLQKFSRAQATEDASFGSR